MNKKLWLFLILLLAIFLRILYMQTGIHYSTSLLALDAYHLNQGIYDPNHVWHLISVRYVLLLLVSASFALFGVSKVSLFLPSFLFSLGTIITVYYFGKYAINEDVGLLAAFLLAILPLDVYNATIMEADIVMNFFITLGLLLYFCIDKEQKSVYYFVAVGMIFSLAYFTKIFTVFVIPILIIYEVSLVKNFRTSITRAMYVAIGFLLVSSPFIIYQSIQTGNLLYSSDVERNYLGSITYIKENLEANIPFVPEENNWLLYVKYAFFIFSSLFFTQKLTDGTDPMLNIYFFFLPLLIYFCFKRKERITTLLLAWILIPIVTLLCYGYVQKVQRYLLISMIPLVLLLAYWLWEMYNKIQQESVKKYLPHLFILCILLISLLQLGKYTLFNPLNSNIIDQEEVIVNALKDLPEKDLYVSHYHSVSAFSFYLKYSKNSTLPFGYRGSTSTSIKDIHFVNSLNDIHDAYVFIDLSYILNTDDEVGYYHKMNVYWSKLENAQIPSQWQSIMPLYSQDKVYGEIFYAP